MSFPGALLELIAEARLNPSRLPVALITFGVVLSAAALALIVFKTPGGIFLRLHGSTPTYLYYGILTVVRSDLWSGGGVLGFLGGRAARRRRGRGRRLA
jgi:hypothetical protein